MTKDAINPKDLIGSKKPALSLIPTAALAHVAQALESGAAKYGRANWRDYPIQGTIYVDAALRHLGAWVDGEDLDPESGYHHLGHAMAGLMILMDAIEGGTMKDDRPNKGPTPATLKRLTKVDPPKESPQPRKLTRNAVQCNNCGDVIESKSAHNMVWCDCGQVAVDGGLDEKRRAYGNGASWVELSKYEGDDETSND
jgi:hypothetical protein